jgi:hypothetical protein
MSKISIYSKIYGVDSDEHITNSQGIKNNNTITFNDNGTLIKVIINDNMVNIERENKEMKLSLEFIEGKEILTDYIIKELNVTMNVKTVTKKLLICKNNLYIEYDLYINNEHSDNFVYYLEWSE